jgi:chromosome segregation ATPase
MKILDMLVSNLEGLGFPVFIYLPSTGETYRVESNVSTPYSMPEIILPALMDESKSVVYFKQGNDVISFFFFRLKNDDEQAVLIIQDGKEGLRPAKVFSLFASAVFNNNSNSVFRSFESDKLLKRELENMISKMTDLEISIGTKDAKIQDLQQRLFIQNELLEKYESQADSIEDHSDEIALLQKLLEQKEDEIKKLNLELKYSKSNTKVSDECLAEIAELKELLLSKDNEIKELSLELESSYSVKGSDTDVYKAEIEKLKSMLADKDEELGFLRLEIESGNIESDALSNKLIGYDDALSDNEIRINELELELEQRSEELIQAEELNYVLKGSRNKMRKLMDGIPMPLFSVDKNYILKNVNRSAGTYAGIEKLNEMVGKECYKVFYGYNKPCAWCRLGEAFKGKEVIDNIEINKEGKIYKFEQHMYPLHNSEDEIDEIGEHLFDMTEQYALINTLESCKTQIKNYKMSKLSDFNEIEELKKEHSTLNECYEELQVKLMKMKGLLERLMSEDKMSELMKCRAENTELRSKLSRTAGALRNYQISLEESRSRYSELNKKTTYQLERLINILGAKISIRSEEAEQSISFINSEIARLKKDYEKLSGGKTNQSGVNK